MGVKLRDHKMTDPQVQAKLIHYELRPDHAKVVKRRTWPLVRYFWHRQGSVSVVELCMAAYVQGVLDASQLKQQHGQAN